MLISAEEDQRNNGQVPISKETFDCTTINQPLTAQHIHVHTNEWKHDTRRHSTVCHSDDSVALVMSVAHADAAEFTESKQSPVHVLTETVQNINGTSFTQRRQPVNNNGPALPICYPSPEGPRKPDLQPFSMKNCHSCATWPYNRERRLTVGRISQTAHPQIISGNACHHHPGVDAYAFNNPLPVFTDIL